jgi:uncharacterized integral membrane protein
MTAGPVPPGGTTPRGRVPQSRTQGNSRRIVALVLLAVAVVFILENRQLTEIRLLLPVVLMPLWAALTGTLLIGLVIGVLVDRQRRR